MPSALLVAADILREAASRRWLLGILAAITLVVLVLAFALELQVVDGVLAGSRLFGQLLGDELRPVDVTLRPAFSALSWTLFIAGTLFGALSCGDFAPELLTPGRIEQLLALPLRRADLVFGTYLGVMLIAICASGYTGVLLTLLFGVKSGVWTPSLLGAALGACTAFATVYGVMLASATWVRSAALSIALGIVVFTLSCTLTVPSVAALFDPGPKRLTFNVLTAWLPRNYLLGQLGPALAGAETLTFDTLRAALASLAFGAACLALAVWNMERKDF